MDCWLSSGGSQGEIRLKVAPFLLKGGTFFKNRATFLQKGATFWLML